LFTKDSEIPYYLQIYGELKDRIETQAYKPNEMLPSENELAEEFNVTRITVRNAIKRLKDEGKIYTKKGKGSFVNPPKIVQDLYKVYSFGREFDEKGYTLESTVIEAYIDKCSGTVQKNLQLQAEDFVFTIRRIRKLDNIPVIAEVSYLPAKLIPGVTIEEVQGTPIYDLLEKKYKLNIIKAKEYLDPAVADEYYSGLLEVEIGTPLFSTERVTYTNGDRPIDYRRCIIRSDKFRFSVELK
jgi:GntR family transcriptional regulator